MHNPVVSFTVETPTRRRVRRAAVALLITAGVLAPSPLRLFVDADPVLPGMFEVHHEHTKGGPDHGTHPETRRGPLAGDVQGRGRPASR